MNNARAVAKTPFFVLLFLIGLGTTFPFYLPPFIIILLISVLMYTILALSWTTFCGPSNYISLATAAIFGVGVYTSAILQELPLPLTILIGGLMSSCLGLVIGMTTLRLSGMYFCIFTFGLSEIFRHTMNWYEVNITATVGRWVTLQNHITVYYYMLAIFLITLVAAYLITRSKWGLALKSIGQTEDAAAHIGINVNAVKIISFAITCFFIGAAGVVMATRWSYIDPDLAFAPFVTFFTIMMVLVGGWGSTLYGPILGAVVLTVLSDMVLASFPRLMMFMFGVILVAVILFFPNGLIGFLTRTEKSSA